MTQPYLHNRFFVRTLGLTFLIVLGATAAFAQTVPTVMNYQGRLTDNSPGQTPIDTTLPMTFRIYDAPMAGSLEWQEVWGGVPVNAGIFSVLLGSNGVPIPSSVFGGATRYLEVEVDGEILTPRQRLGSVGFAQRAENAADVDCVDCVQPGEIAPAAVGSVEVAADSLTASDLAADSVTASEIASGAVGTSEIADGQVATVDLALDSVDAGRIQADAVGNSEINNLDAFTFSGGVNFDRTGAEWISRNGGTAKLEMWADADYSYFYHRPASSYLAVNDATGNWGINTTAPAERLDVLGSVRGYRFIDRNNSAYYVDPASTSVLNLITGNGAGLTNLEAGDIASGTLADARLSANVPLKNQTNIFTADQFVIDGNAYLYLDSTSPTGVAGVLFRNQNSLTWAFYDSDSESLLRLYSYGLPGTVLSIDGVTGNTRVRNLQMSVSTVSDSVGGATNYSPACSVGSTRVGGGCRCASGSLEKSYPSGATAWYCECSTATTVDAYSVCLQSVDP